MMPNIQRQPNSSIRKVSSGGEMALPSVEDVFQMPVAVPRSRPPNQSRTTRAELGNCGASPKPSTARTTMNWPKPVTSPASAWASDHSASAPVSKRRGPNRSIKPPAGNCANA